MISCRQWLESQSTRWFRFPPSRHHHAPLHVVPIVVVHLLARLCARITLCTVRTLPMPQIHPSPSARPSARATTTSHAHCWGCLCPLRACSNHSTLMPPAAPAPTTHARHPMLPRAPACCQAFAAMHRALAHATGACVCRPCLNCIVDSKNICLPPKPTSPLVYIRTNLRTCTSLLDDRHYPRRASTRSRPTRHRCPKG